MYMTVLPVHIVPGYCTMYMYWQYSHVFAATELYFMVQSLLTIVAVFFTTGLYLKLSLTL